MIQTIRHFWQSTAAALLFALPATALIAPSAQAAATSGKQIAVTCSACHGSDGAGQAAAGYPRLAGLNAIYLKRQLDSLANGSRHNAVMSPMAKSLTEAQRSAVAHYFSKLAIPATARKGKADSQANNKLGRKLATRGRWNEQLPACEQCHGPDGMGVGSHFPPLAGQSATYISNQLKAWKSGARHNDPLDLMTHVASLLDANDIKAVAQWFAAQPLQQGESHE